MSLSDWFSRLADWPAVRRVLDVAFAARSRLHLVWLGRLDPARGQWRTLSRLVHRAAATPFGRDHDLGRIRTEDDFRRLVPVRSAAELARSYSRPGAAWPAPSAPDVLAVHRRGLRSALAVACAARPRAGLFSGPVAWLGDALPFDPADAHRLRLPRLLRAAVSPPGHGPASLILGPATRVLGALDDNPSPLAVVTWRQDEADPVDEIQARLPGTVVVEALVRPEGVPAIESPRHGGFHLLAEHGMYFEFVPVDRPGVRLTLAEARVGEDYELIVSAPGTWACRTGLGVRFGRLTPPVFRMVTLPTEAIPAPAPRPRTADIPAGLSGTSVRTPSSARAGRG